LIGIRLGPEFGNLAVVASRSAEQVSAFRQANPALQKGLVTRWNGWHLVWLKTETRANNLAADDWLWLRQGIIPLNGLLGKQDDSQIAADSELPEIPFTEISWPGVLVEGFRVQRLKKEHGPPFRQNGRRRTLNEFFWGYWLSERLGVTYDPKLGVFSRASEPGGKLESLTTAALIHLVHEALQQAAESVGKAFPITELGLSRIRDVIKIIKVATATELCTGAEGLEAYLATRLSPQAGVNVTTEELWTDYTSFCQEGALIAYPQREFLRTVSVRIREKFAIAKAHDIKRDGKPKRGFRALTLQKSQHPNIQIPPITEKSSPVGSNPVKKE